jgi:hypothetical protein
MQRQAACYVLCIFHYYGHSVYHWNYPCFGAVPWARVRMPMAGSFETEEENVITLRHM